MINTSTIGAISDLSTGQSWSSVKLTSEVQRRAGLLAARGITGGSRVVIAHGGTPDFFGDLLAIWQRGACAACANPNVTARELSTLIELIRPDAVVVADDDSNSGAVDKVPAFSLRNGTSASDVLPVDTDPASPALILFTSGSTGVPKAVVLSFGALAARIALNREHIGDARLARSLCLLPTHFGHGLIGNCLTPLAAGGSLYLSTGNSIRTASGLGPLISRENITFLSSVPSFWRMILKMSPPPAPGILQRIHIGSAPLSADLWHEIMEWSGCGDVVNMYGLSETANWIAGASASDVSPADGLVGRMWGGDAAIELDDGQILETGEGSLLVRTPSMMTEYFGQPEMTKEALPQGWLRTGDVGSIDVDGSIRLVGRTRTEINRAGIKIYPEEIELMLERHPSIVDACAFAVPDPFVGQNVGVAVSAVDGVHLERADIIEWCLGEIRREAVPDSWFFLAEIPRTDRGKIDRTTVRRMCLEEEKTL